MPVVLFRIDDRLVHGQVTVAWGAWLSPDRVILVNDEVAGCDWKRDMYAEADPMGVVTSVVTKDEFARADADGRWDEERTIVVIESPSDLLELVRAGVRVGEANVGGLHHAEGKRELLPYVYVDDGDVAAMRELLRLGVRLEARDVPQGSAVDLSERLNLGPDQGFGGT